MKKKIIHIGLVGMIFLAIAFYYNSPSENGLYEDENNYTSEVRATIISVDNEEVMSANISHVGYQKMTIKIKEGTYKDQIFEGSNSLLGQVDMDILYKAGDQAIVAIQVKNGQLVDLKPLELYRQVWLALLFLFFVVTLLIYSGMIGVNALLSFVLSVIVLWEYFIKGLLNGGNPMVLTTITVSLLSGIIIFLVAGISKKGIAAFISTIFGLVITLVLTKFFGDRLELYGLTQAYVQSLVISGYYRLDIQEVFYAAVVLGASGAAIDISMDIATSMDEIKSKKPDIDLKELIGSGLTVGRHVIGTMSTTLLLAYSGSFLTLLMLFQVKNTSLLRMLNLKMVTSEIMRTLIGSTGLILVAPLTALISGLVLTYEFKGGDEIDY